MDQEQWNASLDQMKQWASSAQAVFVRVDIPGLPGALWFTGALQQKDETFFVLRPLQKDQALAFGVALIQFQLSSYSASVASYDTGEHRLRLYSSQGGNSIDGASFVISNVCPFL